MTNVDSKGAGQDDDVPVEPAVESPDVKPAFGAVGGDVSTSGPAAVIRASVDQQLLGAVDAHAAIAEGAAMARDAELRTGASPSVLGRIQNDEVISSFIKLADEFLGKLGFTEHGFRHANLVGRIAYNVLHHLGADEELCELAAIGGYLHDVGNVVSRSNHGLSSAWIAYDALRRLDVDPAKIGLVLSAIGNHEEQYGSAIGPVGAAVILADKADVHRSRVRKGADTTTDIHDRVNDAVTHSFLRVDAQAATITLELELDTERSTVVEYFEIFLDRMVMCRRAAGTLGCEFHIAANGLQLG
ncbi:MAG: metal-dependent HD superfamily phosphatase/phosphodiesterase [Glaciecola sp.]